MHTVWLSVRVAFCGLLLLFMAGSVRAQFKASIQGTITDTTGALIPQAKVTLVNNETRKAQEMTASDEGFYRLSGLAPGSYKLTVEKAGYKQKVFEDVAVSAETTQGIDVALEAGDVTA